MFSFDLVATIVTFHTDVEDIKKCLNSFSSCKLKMKVVIVDNSSNKNLQSIVERFNFTEYIHTGRNIGFSRANNIAVKKYVHKTKYFLFVNPDVYFEPGTIEKTVSLIEQNSDIALIAPKILYPDGMIQTVAKRLPDPFDLILRRFAPNFIKNFFKERMKRYELLDQNLDQSLIIPSASGCFMFYRGNVLEKLEGFDDRFFMYMEDLDICRRTRELGDIVYYPKVVIFHKWALCVYSNIILFLIIISTFSKYFSICD